MKVEGGCVGVTVGVVGRMIKKPKKNILKVAFTFLFVFKKICIILAKNEKLSCVSKILFMCVFMWSRV